VDLFAKMKDWGKGMLITEEMVKRDSLWPLVGERKGNRTAAWKRDSKGVDQKKTYRSVLLKGGGKKSFSTS